MAIRGILYDAGHTLLKPRADREEVWEFLAHQLGVDIAIERRGEFPEVGPFYYARLGGAGLGAYASDEEARRFWSEYYAHALREAGVDLPREELLSAGEAVYDWYKDPAQWEPFQDAIEALIAAERRGYIQGIVSDWGTDLLAIVHAHELTNHLDFVVASANVGVSKPSPEIFRFALERAGLEPAEAVYVGDSYVADILGAQAAGIQPILIDRERRAPRVPVPVVRSLTEVLPLIERLSEERHGAARKGAVGRDRPGAIPM